MCYLGRNSEQVVGKKNWTWWQTPPRVHGCEDLCSGLRPTSVRKRTPIRTSHALCYPTAFPRGWRMLAFTEQRADAFFPAIVCNMFSNSFALFSIWPQREGIMVLTLYPAHILYRLSLNTVSLLQRGIKVKAYRLVLSWAHRGSWSNWKGSRIFKKKEVWPNFNPCHFHFSYPVDLGDFIYTVSLSLGIGNQAFMEIIKST